MKAVRLDNIIHFNPIKISFYVDRYGHPACDLVTEVKNEVDIAFSICSEFHEYLKDIYVGEDFGDIASRVFVTEVNRTYWDDATEMYEQNDVIDLNGEFNYAISEYLDKRETGYRASWKEGGLS